MEKNLSRGLRNCNPGNIRITKDMWQGLRKEQTDPDFFQFEEMKWGYRALLRTLQNYRRRHGCQTIRDFISRWAPANENDTEAYIRSVRQSMGVSADFIPDINSKDTMCALAAAISRHENGVVADMEDVEKGWELL